MDNAISFRNTYPLDSDLSGGYRYQTFEQPGHDFLRGRGGSFQIKIMVGEQKQYPRVKLLVLCYHLKNRKN